MTSNISNAGPQPVRMTTVGVYVNSHMPRCTLHDGGSYNPKYDSFFCEVCNRWLEQKCERDDCRFCAERPDRPHEESTAVRSEEGDWRVGSSD